MTTLLHITVSPRGPASHSRKVGDDLCARLLVACPGLQVTTRDLGNAPLPHPDRDYVTAMLTPAEARQQAHDAALVVSETVIGELEAADIVVLATPVHNFTVPSALKAWIDHVVRINRTFRNSPEGKIGFLRDRPVLVIGTSGGRFGDDAAAQRDFFAPYLRYLFSTIGITSLEILRMELLTRGPEPLAAAYAKADLWMAAQVARLSPERAGN